MLVDDNVCGEYYFPAEHVDEGLQNSEAIDDRVSHFTAHLHATDRLVILRYHFSWCFPH